MKTTLITAPSVEPITMMEIKDHLRIDLDDDAHDFALTRLLKAARERAETVCWKVFIQQTWDIFFDAWPLGDSIELPKPPLISVTTLTYTDYAGATTALVENTDFVVDTDSEYGRIVLEYDKTWPTDTLHPKNPIKARIIAGFANDGNSPPDYRANVPEQIKQAIMLMAGHWFNHREDTIAGSTLMRIPNGAENLLKSVKAWRL